MPTTGASESTRKEGGPYFILLSLFHPSFLRRAKGRTGSHKGRHTLWTGEGDKGDNGRDQKDASRVWLWVGGELCSLSSLFSIISSSSSSSSRAELLTSSAPMATAAVVAATTAAVWAVKIATFSSYPSSCFWVLLLRVLSAKPAVKSIGGVPAAPSPSRSYRNAFHRRRCHSSAALSQTYVPRDSARCCSSPCCQDLSLLNLPLLQKGGNLKGKTDKKTIGGKKTKSSH